MPLFEIHKTELKCIEQSNFNLEKDLQHVIEKNLNVVFNSKFVAFEFAQALCMREGLIRLRYLRMAIRSSSSTRK